MNTRYRLIFGTGDKSVDAVAEYIAARVSGATLHGTHGVWQGKA